jgi:tetratricopeptide (TPR) repeat protein
MNKPYFTLVGLLSLLILTSTAWAGPAEDLAREKTKTGTAAFNLGQYNEAAADYEAAYKAVMDPVLLYNIGQAHRLGGNPEKALTAYRSYLRTAHQGATNRKFVEEKIRELETEIAAKPVEKNAPKPLPEATRAITPPPPAPVVSPPSLPPTPEPPTPPPAPSETRLAPAELPENTPVVVAKTPLPAANQAGGGRTWTWVAGGATLLFAGTAITSGSLLLSKFASLDKDCGSSSVDRPGCREDDIDAVAVRRTVANVFWGLTAAAAITTGILFFTEGSNVSAAPMVGSTNGLLLEGRF